MIPTKAMYGGDRPSLLRIVPSLRGLKVLDVGCGGGGLSKHLRAAGASYVAGVEPRSDLANTARKTLDKLIESSIEDAIRLDLAGSSWDLIILGDVLEHLVDPWGVMAQLAPLVCKGGHMLISLPNVAHYRVIGQLIKHKDWAYDESGTFDKTHLRWFGRTSLSQLILQSGLRPEIWAGQVGFGFRRIQYSRDVESLRFWPRFTIYQFLVLCGRPIGVGPE
jgi:2-polyprenyl-3-methyl-5-hydroxy-6-metoxy-1,4-benzoquinol methylase